MSDSFFQYIHNNRDSSSRHLYVFETEEKRYYRQHYETLPAPEYPEVSLVEALRSRKSCNAFSDQPISLQSLSNLLALSLAKDSKHQGAKGYSFPSGGGFFPLETYVVIKKGADCQPGLYHYKSTEHALTLLSSACMQDPVYDEFLPDVAQPTVFMLMTMVKSRTIQKYGSLSYYLALVEAGHRGQNVYLAAAAHNLGCRAFGYNDYEKINQWLGIDGNNEHYIYGLGIGHFER